MGHDDDGKSFFQLKDKLFDLAGGDGVESRAGLVHQQHLRLDRDGASDTEALLLASGQAGARLLAHRVLDLVPQRGKRQRTLDDFIQALALMEAIERQSGGHVVINRHRRKGIGFLENHADAAANLHR